jgi:VWFA-related protein
MKKSTHAACAAFILLPLMAFPQQAAPPAAPAAQSEPPAPQAPALSPRPAGTSAPASEEGRIHLDVMVSEKSGKPVSGLQLQDFALKDNNLPAKVLSFQAHDDDSAATDPPVAVILLIDMVNTPFSQLSYARQQVVKFLRQNGGHLAHPVSIYVLTDQGVMVQPSPPTDGNALADDLNKVDSSLRSVGRTAQGIQGDAERFQLSLKMMMAIADSEAKKPGRKLLIWPGPGWPLLEWGSISPAKKHTQIFNSIVGLSAELRESRIDLCSMLQSETNGFVSYKYRDFLKGVKTDDKANPGNLDLGVLSVQSGGRVLDASNDLTAQIDNCVEDAGAYYTLSFDPPRPDHANEYHDLKVQIDKPGLTARTQTGYYNQP